MEHSLWRDKLGTASGLSRLLYLLQQQDRGMGQDRRRADVQGAPVPQRPTNQLRPYANSFLFYSKNIDRVNHRTVHRVAHRNRIRTRIVTKIRNGTVTVRYGYSTVR